MSKRKQLDPIIFSDNGIDGITSIDLTKGLFARIDLVDLDLDNLTWTASETGDKVYALRRDPATRKPILMHRVIMQRILGRPLAPGEIVDHKDDCGINNNRANLRLSDASGNAANTRHKKTNNKGEIPTSIYKGVSFIEKKQKWYSQISYKGKKFNLGYFDSEIEAAKTYDKRAIDFRGIDTKLNFPYEKYASPEHLQNRGASRKSKLPTQDNIAIK